jgi:hypothetical protein
MYSYKKIKDLPPGKRKIIILKELFNMNDSKD